MYNSHIAYSCRGELYRERKEKEEHKHPISGESQRLTEIAFVVQLQTLQEISDRKKHLWSTLLKHLVIKTSNKK